ncbi:MAG TPA: hypothetical protein ENI23_07905 [bacterium]|nr:hypothetical protein [bacterium]
MENDDGKSHVRDTKKQIAERNKDNQAINSHVTTLRDNMLGLVVVYRDGTYDKHTINFNRQSYITFLNQEENIVKFKGKIYKLVPHIQGEENG